MHMEYLSNKQSSLFYDFNAEKIHETIVYIVDKLKKVPKFKLAKLLYLIDLDNIKMYNKLLTKSFYIRLYDGPLSTDFEKRLLELEKKEITTIYKNKMPIICSTGKQRFKIRLKEEEIDIINNILDKYSTYSNKRLKNIVYLSSPMRRILKREKDGSPMYGKPIFISSDFNK